MANRNKSKAWTSAGKADKPPEPPQPAMGQHQGVSFERVDEHAVAVAEPPPPLPPARPTHEEDPYLTFSDVARRVGKSVTTISNWVNQRLLKAEWNGPRLCIRESTLRAYMGREYVPPEDGQ